MQDFVDYNVYEVEYLSSSYTLYPKQANHSSTAEKKNFCFDCRYHECFAIETLSTVDIHFSLSLKQRK